MNNQDRAAGVRHVQKVGQGISEDDKAVVPTNKKTMTDDEFQIEDESHTVDSVVPSCSCLLASVPTLTTTTEHGCLRQG